MNRTTIKRSIALRKELIPAAVSKAEANGQSFSSYVSLLIAADLGLSPKPKSKKAK